MRRKMQPASISFPAPESAPVIVEIEHPFKSTVEVRLTVQRPDVSVLHVTVTATRCKPTGEGHVLLTPNLAGEHIPLLHYALRPLGDQLAGMIFCRDSGVEIALMHDTGLTAIIPLRDH